MERKKSCLLVTENSHHLKCGWFFCVQISENLKLYKLQEHESNPRFPRTRDKEWRAHLQSHHKFSFPDPVGHRAAHALLLSAEHSAKAWQGSPGRSKHVVILWNSAWSALATFAVPPPHGACSSLPFPGKVGRGRAGCGPLPSRGSRGARVRAGTCRGKRQRQTCRAGLPFDASLRLVPWLREVQARRPPPPPPPPGLWHLVLRTGRTHHTEPLGHFGTTSDRWERRSWQPDTRFHNSPPQKKPGANYNNSEDAFSEKRAS